MGELLHLRLDDLHHDRNRIFSQSGRGKKDRYALLSPRMKTQLAAYHQAWKPRYWLFEGPLGEPYPVRSVQAILRKAVEKAKVNPCATVHTLRHSFATHLLEAGTNNRHLQELVGHNSLKATEIYTPITAKGGNQIKSPLENLDLGDLENSRNTAHIN